ncbi:hypothetical protein CR513_30709, partial [Mucuna pruriens]
MIVKCGGYPNVPLLGTQGAINYNPELVVQQAGYPMIRPPLEEVIPVVLYGQEAHNGAHYRKIRHAWSNVRTRSYGISPSYRIWLENQVKLVRLPWGRILPQEPEAQAYEVQETLEVGKLKVTLEQVEAEGKDLKRRLETAMEEVHRERQLNNETAKRA